MRRSLLTGVFFAAGLLVWAQTGQWSRQYVAESPLSLELPGKLGAAEVTKVEDEEDWVLEAVDQVFESERYFLQATIFRGRPSVKADGAFLKQVSEDIAGGVAGPEDEVRTTEVSAAKLDEKEALRQTIVVGKEGEQVVVRSLLVGDGSTVYAVLAVAYPQVQGSVAEVDRVMRSVRFKRGL